jgi:hypothetical protein
MSVIRLLDIEEGTTGSVLDVELSSDVTTFVTGKVKESVGGSMLADNVSA